MPNEGIRYFFDNFIIIIFARYISRTRPDVCVTENKEITASCQEFISIPLNENKPQSSVSDIRKRMANEFTIPEIARGILVHFDSCWENWLDRNAIALGAYMCVWESFMCVSLDSIPVRIFKHFHSQFTFFPLANPFDNGAFFLPHQRQ